MSKVEAYLKVADVAKYAGLSVDAVRELIENGELEALELNGRTKVRKSEIDRWLDEKVDLENLLKLTDKIDGEVDLDEAASALDVEVEELKEALEDN